MTHKRDPKKPFLPLNIQFFAGGEEEKTLQTLSADFKTATTELKGLLDQQADEMRQHGETSTKTAAQVKSAEEKYVKLEQDFAGVQNEIKELQKQAGRPNYFGGQKAKSVGAQFAESDVYKTAQAANAKSTGSFSVKSFFGSEFKDLDSTDANGGLLTGTYTYPEIIAPNNQQMRLRDLMNVAPITASSIEYIEESSFLNNAATVAEKVQKPQSDLSFEQKTAQVRTIATWLPATRNVMDDAAQLRNYVDNRLLYALAVTEESQILYGSGTGEDLLGLMVHDGVQNIGTRADADTTLIDHIRRAITRSRLAGYPVTAIVLNPEDWETIELSKGTDGHYIFTSVNVGGEARLFRVPVVESTGMQSGEFLAGSLGMAAQLLDRQQANVRVSENHSDYFTRNMLAILAEERLAMPIYRPDALVKGSFDITAV